MNDPRHPVQPAPAAPAMRPTPMAPTQQTTLPRPAGAPAAHPTHAHPAHAPQPARPAGAGMPAHQQQPPQRPMQSPQPQVVRPMQSPMPGGAMPPAIPGQSRPAPAPAHAGPVPVDDEAIALEDADDDGDGDLLAAPTTPSKIKFGAEVGIKKHAWKRQPVRTGTGACRVRTFHGKLSDQGLEYVDEAINVWLDEHPEIDIKFVTTNVGMFDGKFKDLALVVNVWY